MARMAKIHLLGSYKLGEVVQFFSKGDLGLLVGLLPCHEALKYHLYNLGEAEDLICHLCQEELDMAEHILCECVAVSHFRRSFLNLSESSMVILD